MEPTSTQHSPNPAQNAGQQSSGMPCKLPRLTPREKPKQKRVNQDPIPATPPLPGPLPYDSIAFQKPSRRILSSEDHQRFLSSPAYHLVLAWIFHLADSVQGQPIPTPESSTLSPSVTRISKAISEIQESIDRNPPRDTGSRFGNRREPGLWFGRVVSRYGGLNGSGRDRRRAPAQQYPFDVR